MTLTPATKAEPAQAQKRLQQALLEAFSQARVKNPSYSLRAFARKLGLSPSAVSEILAGKRDVSAKLALRALERLNTSPSELKKLTQGLIRTSQKSDVGAKQQTSKVVSILSNDQFKSVTDWYHFGVLALMETEGCERELGFFSKRLGVPRRDISAALERLERLGMLRRDIDGKLQLTGEQYHSSDGVASSAVRAAQVQALELAKKSIETDSVDVRDNKTLTFAIDTDQLPKARAMINKFRTDLAKLLERNPQKEVYMLTVHLFPLSKAIQSFDEKETGE